MFGYPHCVLNIDPLSINKPPIYAFQAKKLTPSLFFLPSIWCQRIRQDRSQLSNNQCFSDYQRWKKLLERRVFGRSKQILQIDKHNKNPDKQNIRNGGLFMISEQFFQNFANNCRKRGLIMQIRCYIRRCFQKLLHTLL